MKVILYRNISTSTELAVFSETETLGEQLKSIIAQMEYKHEVMSYDKNGIPFKSHLYVPETDSVTNMEFQEREDHNHVLKVSIMKYNTAGAQQNLPSFHHTQNRSFS